MIIAFDFDGVITKDNNYPLCLELRDSIDDCIRSLKSEGHNIIIYTCRSVVEPKQQNAFIAMCWYLEAKNIPYDTINANVDPTTKFNPTKPFWHILVDDTALGWNDNWNGEDIYNLIQDKINNNKVNSLDTNLK